MRHRSHACHLLGKTSRGANASCSERNFRWLSGGECGRRLWDGTMWPDDRPRKSVLALNHPGALGRMFLPGTEVALAEVHGVFTFPARHTDFGVVILPFTKHCSQSWTH